MRWTMVLGRFGNSSVIIYIFTTFKLILYRVLSNIPLCPTNKDLFSFLVYFIFSYNLLLIMIKLTKIKTPLFINTDFNDYIVLFE